MPVNLQLTASTARQLLIHVRKQLTPAALAHNRWMWQPGVRRSST